MNRKNWQQYQNRLLRQDRTRRPALVFMILIAVTCGLVLRGAVSFGNKISAPQSSVENSLEVMPEENPAEIASPAEPLQHKAGVMVSKYADIIKELSIPRHNSEFAKTHAVERPTTLNMNVQGMLQETFDKYNPSYAAAVVLDATTGDVLAMVGHRSKSSRQDMDFLPTRAVFPAASVFKIVTAAAGIEHGGVVTTTQLRTVGNPYHLYPSKLSEKALRRGKAIELSKALARSDNVAFAYLTRNFLNEKSLRETALSFGFDRDLIFDLPVDQSPTFYPEDSFGLAKTSTGLGENRLSPLHAAIIAAAIANNGKGFSPRLFEDEPSPSGSRPFIDIAASTAYGLGTMMKRTITQGTARKAFRGFQRHPVLGDSEIAGKTGSLTSDQLSGHCEWFVGFGKRHDKKIALSVVMINGARWHIKPAQVAKRVFEDTLRETRTAEVVPTHRRVKSRASRI